MPLPASLSGSARVSATVPAGPCAARSDVPSVAPMCRSRPVRRSPTAPRRPASAPRPPCRPTLCLSLALTLSALGGCGNRGELYLAPDEAFEREVRELDERLPAARPDVDVTTPADTVNSRTPLPADDVADPAPPAGEADTGEPLEAEEADVTVDEDASRRPRGERGPADRR